MAAIDTLITARDNIATRIEEITRSPKPSYSIDGETVQWAAYLATLVDKLEALEALISVKQQGGGFHQTQGFT